MVGRCRATLFLLRHDPMLRQKRDEHGRVLRPHVVVWECRRCGRAVGETALVSQWGLIAKLRRQAAALRRRSA